MTLIEVNRQIANGLLSSLQSTVDEARGTEQGEQTRNPANEAAVQPMISSIDKDV